jgi:hypothetical protein
VFACARVAVLQVRKGGKDVAEVRGAKEAELAHMVNEHC